MVCEREGMGREGKGERERGVWYAYKVGVFLFCMKAWRGRGFVPGNCVREGEVA